MNQPQPNLYGGYYQSGGMVGGYQQPGIYPNQPYQQQPVMGGYNNPYQQNPYQQPMGLSNFFLLYKI